jgi:SAM-dependent methyltransferase
MSRFPSHWRWYLSAMFYQRVDLHVAHQADEDFFAYLGDRVRGAIIADCGCGPGIVVEKFLERGAAKVYAIDVNPWMLVQVRRRTAGCPDPERVQIILQAFNPAFFQSLADHGRGLAFDIILFKRSLYVRPEQARRILFAASKCLIPGGMLVIIHPQDSLRRYAFGSRMKLESYTGYYLFNRTISQLGAWMGIGEYSVYNEPGLLDMVRASLPDFRVESVPTSQSPYNIVVAYRPLDHQDSHVTRT